MTVMRTEAIKRMLIAYAKPDLAALYNPNMEVQVNVAQDGGEKVDGEYRGKQWQGWKDDTQMWKSFRIPYKAKSEPEYIDRPITFDLHAHAESIGMTGWDWKNRQSLWVAYDFDAIIGHSESHGRKQTAAELLAIQEACSQIPWITIRKSTSGNGLHLYVFLHPVHTSNHNEHAALARSILGVISAMAGVDFSAKVDTCGGNMWVWHRKSRGTDGLSIIKEGTEFMEAPVNWHDHIKVISGASQRVVPSNIEETGTEDEFVSLVGRVNRHKLDDGHKAHMAWLSDNNCIGWWDSDNHMLVTHTTHLKSLHDAMDLQGYFETNSSHSSPHNCFCFPIKNGAWVIRRYTLGVDEHASWEQDGAGWTRCYFNQPPSLTTACRAMGGVEDTNGEFQFRHAEDAIRAAALLQAHVHIHNSMMTRPATLKEHKDGRIIFSFEHDKRDEGLPNWIVKKGKYQRLFNSTVAVVDRDLPSQDELIRHMVSSTNEDAGWAVKINDIWNMEPVANVKFVLAAKGIKQGEISETLGSAVLNCWKVVSRPFQPEYPGDRLWNRDSAQLCYTPSDPTTLNLKYPTWSAILNHCGETLTPYISKNEWCYTNGIRTGGDYLKCWAASVFQFPERRLPYLFFFSTEENTGKSSFFEALGTLLTKGLVKAAGALTNPQGFNGELQGSIICVVEEMDISKGLAYNRLKEWVTAKELCVHPKHKTPYHVVNTTHWIQCANNHNYCPVFPGDTRITVIRVPKLKNMIPTEVFYENLDREAPDFLADLMSMELPRCQDRLNIPVIETGEKQIVKAANMSEFEQFLADCCEPVDGAIVKFSHLWDEFYMQLDTLTRAIWTKQKMGKSLPAAFPKGRLRKDNQFYIGNLQFREAPQDVESTKIWVASPESEYLILADKVTGEGEKI